MGKLRLHCPALPYMARRKVALVCMLLPQMLAQCDAHLEAVLYVLTHAQAERAGLVIRHQQLAPVIPVSKLYSGWGIPQVPSVELHDDTPDTV